MAFLCVNTPHIDVYVKKEYLYDNEKGHGELVEGVWVSAKSIQGRALYFETYIPEYGALYDKLPISGIVNTSLEIPIRGSNKNKQKKRRQLSSKYSSGMSSSQLLSYNLREYRKSLSRVKPTTNKQ